MASQDHGIKILLDMNEFAQLVKDKQVLLVGNGNSLVKRDNSKLIDSYEFVIRFNLAIKKEHPHQGKKIDAWFYTMVKDSRCKRTYNLAKIKPRHCIRHHTSPLVLGENNYLIDTEIYRKKFNRMLNLSGSGDNSPTIRERHASTGLCCIHYLKEYCNPKSISIIGFDSFSTKNFYEKNFRLDSIKTCHSPDIEKDYLKKLSEEKSIQIID